MVSELISTAICPSRKSIIPKSQSSNRISIAKTHQTSETVTIHKINFLNKSYDPCIITQQYIFYMPLIQRITSLPSQSLNPAITFQSPHHNPHVTSPFYFHTSAVSNNPKSSNTLSL